MNRMSFLFFLGVFTAVQGSPFLLFSKRHDIRLFDVSNGNTTIVIDSLDHAVGVDFLYEESSIFWTDVDLKVIKHAWLNGSHNSKTIVTAGLESPDGLATDWLCRKVYWTDSETNRIEVCETDGSNRRVLYWEGLDQPRAIVLDPLHGYMYWTDVGANPKIERGGMDGSDFSRTVLINDNIFWPNGLTLDYEDSRLYWIDAKLHYIHSCDLNGQNRRAVADRDFPHPFALTLLDLTLYWTDWQTRSVYSCDKLTGRNRKVLQTESDPMDIHVYSKNRQPKGSIQVPCDLNNGGCSHLCLKSPIPPYYKCVCPTGVKILSNNKICADGPEEFLVFATRTDIRKINLDTPDFTDVVIPVEDVRHAIAIDFDPIDGHVYWTDDEIPKISRSDLDGTGQEIVVGKGIKNPDGVAVDWIGRNLYWTDTGLNTIQVSRLNGTSRTVLISKDLDEPRAICLDPVSGLMFWTDWGKIAKIERANMDGSDRVVLINSSLGWPNGVVYDSKEQQIFWADAKFDKIEVAHIDGKGRRVLLDRHLPHIFGFSLMGDYIYWSDWQKRAIQRANIRGRRRRYDIETIADQLPNLMGLKAVKVQNIEGTNECARNNFGCSHLCLVRRGSSPICVCPSNMELDRNGKTCVIPDVFLYLTNGQDISRLSLDTGHHLKLQIPVQGVMNVLAIDIHINDSRIYWIDAIEKSIQRAYLNGSALEHIVQYGLSFPEDLAVDWLSNNIYWVDIGTKRIEVARTDGSSRKVLVWTNIRHPRALAIDPLIGYMFWTDWAEPHTLERAALDGTMRKVLLQNLRRPHGLTIDYSDHRLYWGNLERKSIESVDTEGNNRTQIIGEDIGQPMRLTLYQDYLVWVDWQKHTMEQVHKVSGINRTILQSRIGTVMDVVAHQLSREPGESACGDNNGGCSHLCLPLPVDHPSNSTHQCACPTHYLLNKDNVTCSAPTSSLIFSQRNQVSRIVISSEDDVLNSLDVVIPIEGLHNIKAISYDPVDQYIYAIDGKTWTIKRIHDGEKQATTVVANWNKKYKPYDIAVDPYTRSLFWTCSSTNEITITKLNQTTVEVVIHGENEKPRSIVIDAVNGQMYWTNMISNPTIEKAAFDGRDRTSLIFRDILRPGPLTIDVVEQKLYWADSRLQRIESSDLTGGNRQVIVEGEVRRPKGVTVLGDYLYWIDKKYMAIERANKTTGEDRIYIKVLVNGLSDLTDAQNNVVMVTPHHPCAQNNGGCSHICIPNSDGTSRCSCPYKLRLRHRTSKECVSQPSCSSEQFTCLSGGIDCIPLVWRCDGMAECEDRSDELGCPADDISSDTRVYLKLRLPSKP